MSALSLHLPEQRGIARWSLSAIAIAAAHAAIATALVLWYTREPREPNVIDAIAVTYAPPTSAAAPAPKQDLAVGKPQEQQEEVLPEPPRVEQQPEQKVEKIELPPPPVPAEVVLPKPTPKPEKEKKEVKPQPRQEERAAARSDAPQQSAVPASQAYNRLVVGHLRQYTQAAAARIGSGRVTVHFVLSRQGQVLSSRIANSSGISALDREALAIVTRADPFPRFPDEKTGASDAFEAPINFTQR